MAAFFADYGIASFPMLEVLKFFKSWAFPIKFNIIEKIALK